MGFLRNAGSLAATSLIGIPIGLATSVILARALGPEEMGFYSILQRFVAIAFILCLLGTQSASIYRLRGAHVTPSLVATTSLSIVLASSLSVTAALFLGGVWLSTTVLGDPPLMTYYIALVGIPAQAVGRMLMSFARGLDRFALSNAYLLSIWIGSLVALSMGFAFFGIGLFGAVGIVTGVHVGSTLLLGARIFYLTGIRMRTTATEITETVRYGIKSQGQVILTYLHENIDVVILASLLGAPDQVAFYAIATGIVNRIKILPASIANAFLPHVAGLDAVRAATLAARASRHSLVWICAIAIGGAAATPIVVPWAYGDNFGSAVRPILILLPATVFLSVNGLLARYFMAMNRQGVVIRTQSCSATLNICMNFALIPKFGIDGAALASLTSYGVEFAMIASAFRYSTGIPFRRILFLDLQDFREYANRASSLRRLRRSEKQQ